MKRKIQCIKTLRLWQNVHHFPDDIFIWIFLNKNVWILINISLKFVPKDPINNIPSLVQIIAWHRPGDKPLSEPMMVRLLMHICVIRPQLVNDRYAPCCNHIASQKIVITNNMAMLGASQPQRKRTMLLIRRPFEWNRAYLREDGQASGRCPLA